MNIQQKVDHLIGVYNSRRRTDDYEPKYIIDPYDVIFAFQGIQENGKKSNKSGVAYLKDIYGEGSDKELLETFENNCLDSLLCPDGTVCNGHGIFPDRVIHDGYKVGTTSWVFMGRNESPVYPVKYMGKTLYAVGRTVPPEIQKMLKPLHPELGNTVWCAYDLDGQYGVEIGPLFSLDQIVEVARSYGGSFNGSF